MTGGVYALQPEPLKVILETISDAPPDGCGTSSKEPEIV